MLVLAIGGLGWLGYQLVASNLVARHAHTTEKDELRAQWAQPGPEPTATPGAAFGLLRIPRFGDDYEVPILSGTDLETLSRGVGHYSSTALPGQVGNVALTGHRVTHGQPFSRLLELDAGDQVILETREAVFSYVIDQPPRNLTVPAGASWVLDPLPGQPGATPTQALLTLTTAQDLLPTGDRSVGFGHLASTTNKR